MDLNKIRREIDRIDNSILRALQRRIEWGRLTLKFKKKILSPEREQAIVNSLMERERSLLSSEVIEAIYQTIFTESRRVQAEARPLIAFKGEHGAFTEVACREWNKNLAPIPCATNSDVIEGIEQGVYDFGMLPIENTIVGRQNHITALLSQSKLHIVGAISIPVEECLLVVPGAPLTQLRRVYSHPMALAECKVFIHQNNLDAIEYFDTAGAAQWLAETQPDGTAVIAGELAAKYYHLEVARHNVGDNPHAATRFLVVGSEPKSDGGNKTTISFFVKNEPGALAAIMNLFADSRINLSHIDSVLDSTGDYVFYVDIDANINDAPVAKVMDQVEKLCDSCRVLGCYNEIK
ncbi:MAG: chorismate mutase [Thermoguttaceae bacterium]|nr:chorismate mutase [Thermoguttaceae bacterium]